MIKPTHEKITKKRICWINQYNNHGKFYFYRIEVKGDVSKSIPCDNKTELIKELRKLL